MILRKGWVDKCLELAGTPAHFYSGARKILRNQHFTFRAMREDLHMEDLGYTKSKMTMLTKNYVHEESKAVAIDLWNKRLGQRKYGSVSFTTFNHFVKGGSVDAKRSKRASVFGPCIQSVSVTYIEGKEPRSELDVFYRTTELLKKFPADLVFFRDVLMKGFDFSTAPLAKINFHFANVTVHPMYFVTLLPHLEDPCEDWLDIKELDPRFFDWSVKWTARYMIPGYHRGIEKFAQAMRVKAGADALITGKKRDRILEFCQEHHPGYRSDYVPPEGEDDDEAE